MSYSLWGRHRGFVLESMPRQITAILKIGNRSADLAV
jgi:hypothetical protein